MYRDRIYGLQLEITFPEDKSLSPIEMSNKKDEIENFCKMLGLSCKSEYLEDKEPKHELNQKLISRINNFYQEVFKDLRTILKCKSEKTIKNKYYEMVYAILNYHQYGIANKKGNKLKKLSYRIFEKIFEVDRRTTSRNQSVVDFRDENRYKMDNDLKYIYDEIERKIIQ